ncbi:MAG: serine protein kinase RIO [Nanoarchaeota archaeon]|nr:serine protein kinase RIO [Nanoarchaeota archaeon]
MRKEKEIFKIYKEVFDLSTEKTIYKLSNDGYIDYFIGPISTGKEANVFLAKNPEGESIAVKIYRIETSNFKNMWKYIAGDERFSNVKKRRRDIVFAWARKEFKNLELAKRAKASAPEPIACRNNVLVMEFIGTNNIPAPIAKIAPPKKPETWFKKIFKDIKRLYQKANLVHGDLSEYNILNNKEKPVLIDFGQGVLFDHPNANQMLMNDVKNIANWLKKLGLKLPSIDELFKFVVGKNGRI